MKALCRGQRTAGKAFCFPSSSTITWLGRQSGVVIDVFVDELDLQALGFEGVVPETTGRPAYHPATMLKIYLYGYINNRSSRVGVWSAKRRAMSR